MGEDARAPRSRPLLRPAPVVALLTLLVLLATAGRYGYHRDELYFLQAGRHLAWGYPDQPPLVPLLARLLDAGPWAGSLVVLRTPSALAAASVVLLAGLMARRLGADSRGELLAAAGTALCGLVLGTGHLLSTSTVLVLGTTVVTWLVLLLAQGGDRRLWLVVGLVGGVTVQAHVLVGFVLLALALTSRRRLGPLVAGVVALAIGLPYLVWQATHGWPQLDVASSISDGGSATSVPRALFLVTLLVQLGVPQAPVWVLGIRRALADASLRAVPLAFLLLVVLFVAVGGKPYYVAGFLPFLMAAGAQPLVDAAAGWVPVLLLVLAAPVLVGIDPDFCVAADDLGRIDMPVDSDEDGTLLVACEPERPWAELWPDLVHLG